MYHKITNETENHNGYQYKDKMNILAEPFVETRSCCPGGLYFTDIRYILEFLIYGIYLREIILPINDKNFKMVKDGENKWRSNKVILGTKYDLCNIDPWEYLTEKWASIHTYSYAALNWILNYKVNQELVNYLLEKEESIFTPSKIIAYNPYPIHYSDFDGDQTNIYFSQSPEKLPINCTNKQRHMREYEKIKIIMRLHNKLRRKN